MAATELGFIHNMDKVKFIGVPAHLNRALTMCAASSDFHHRHQCCTFPEVRE